jgi:hypothetical protein
MQKENDCQSTIMFTANFDNNSEIEAKVCFQYNNKNVSHVNIHEFQGI